MDIAGKKNKSIKLKIVTSTNISKLKYFFSSVIGYWFLSFHKTNVTFTIISIFEKSLLEILIYIIKTDIIMISQFMLQKISVDTI